MAETVLKDIMYRFAPWNRVTWHYRHTAQQLCLHDLTKFFIFIFIVLTGLPVYRNSPTAVLQETKRPSKEMQVTIARQLGLEPTTVGNFFMNARRRSMDKWKDEDPKTVAVEEGQLSPTIGIGQRQPSDVLWHTSDHEEYHDESPEEDLPFS